MHMFLGKDLYICYVSRPCLWDNQNLEHILDGNLYMDHHDILTDKCKLHHCIVHLLHKERDRMDRHAPVLFLHEDKKNNCNNNSK